MFQRYGRTRHFCPLWVLVRTSCILIFHGGDALGEATTKKLRERFQLDKSERGAAEFMISCIKYSHENTRR